MKLTSIIYKVLFASAMVIASAFTAVAEYPAFPVVHDPAGWDGITSEQPEGSGTTALDPFLISKPEHIKWLHDNPDQWVAGRFFRQIASIDLNFHQLYDAAHPWAGIGYGDSSMENDYNHANYIGMKIFRAVYNGDGYTISNLYVPVENVGPTNSGFGLFGAVGAGGTVRNLVVDNALVVLTDMADTGTSGANRFSRTDMRISPVVAQAGPGATVENIAVHNSRVTDLGVAHKTQTAFFGGVVADVNSGYAGYAVIQSSFPAITLRNLYADVRFELANVQQDPTTTSKYNQFLIGGITGRVRRGKIEDLPDYTYYRGYMEGPTAIYSPTVALARCNGATTIAGYADAYMGEYPKNPSNGSTSGTFYSVVSPTANPDFATNRRYSQYFGLNCFDSANPVVQEINESLPEGILPGMHTFGGAELRSNITTATTLFTQSNPGNIRDHSHFQGVGLATYDNDMESVIAMFNSYADAHTGCISWIVDPTTGAPTLVCTDLTIEFNRESMLYDFNVVNPIPDQEYTVRVFATSSNGTRTEVSATPLVFNSANNYAASFNLENPEQYVSLTGMLYTSNGLNVVNKVVPVTSTAYLNLEADVLNNFTLSVGNSVASTEYTIKLYGLMYDETERELAVFENVTGEVRYNLDYPELYNSIIAELYVPNVALASRAEMLIDRQVHVVVAGRLSWTQTGIDHFRAETINPQGDSETGDYYTLIIYGHNGAESGDFTELARRDPFGGTQIYDFQLANHNAFSYLRAELRIMDTPHVPIPEYPGVNYLVDYQTIPISSLMLTYGLEIEPVYAATDPSGSATTSGYYYRASVHNIAGGHIVAGGPDNLQQDGYSWLWEVSSDPTNVRSWEPTTVDDYGQCWINPNRTDRFYRVSWRRWAVDDDNNYVYDAAGNHLYEVLAEAVYGPKNVIFVYDKAKTEDIRYAVDPVTHKETKRLSNNVCMVTSFDGIDKSLVAAAGLTLSHDPVSDRPILKDANGNDVADITPYEFPDGDDLNTGYSPHKAVKSMRRAYELCDASRGVDDNVIVIMGYYWDRDLWNVKNAAHFQKPATITGNRGELIYDGAINVIAMEEGSSNPHPGLQAATTFSQITWTGFTMTGTNSATNEPYVPHHMNRGVVYFYANLHDLTFADGVKMMGYRNISTSGSSTFGLLDGSKAPDVTIVAGIHNYNGYPVIDENGKTTTCIEIPDRPDNKVPNFTTLDINSGVFGRIIAGARNDGGGFNAATHNVFGSNVRPHRVRVNISITHTDPTKIHEYAPDYPSYDYDIGLLTGGQTDGSVFCEADLYMNDGSVGRFISGNISYGRKTFDMLNPAADRYPSDSFFGSTTFTMQGGKIVELYGGSLGRHNASNGTPFCEAYFYGQSIINIEAGEITNNIYGSGAGGTSGVGDIFAHTDDRYIPYIPLSAGVIDPAVHKVNPYTGEVEMLIDSKYSVKYGSYDEIYGYTDEQGNEVPRDGYVPKFPMRDGSLISFVNSYSEVNLSGGTIGGNVYGAGYGYSSQITYDKATSQAGNLYGSSRVTTRQGISLPPVIKGNIYGAGAGTREYYDAAIAGGTKALLIEQYQDIYDQAYEAHNGTAGAKEKAAWAAVETACSQTDKDAAESVATARAAAKFSSLGKLYGYRIIDSDGNTTGVAGATIQLDAGEVWGDVYGGSEGVYLFPEMATVYGNTDLTISGAKVYGDIYGGCSFADVRRHLAHSEDVHQETDDTYDPLGRSGGNTRIRINDGAIGNCIFGGSRGETDQATTIEGSTFIDIVGGSYLPSPRLYKPVYNKTTKTVELIETDEFANFNIYGGGRTNCNVVANTNLYLEKSLLTDEASMIPEEDNPNSAPHALNRFDAAFRDHTMRRYCVYGGGYGEQTNVRRRARVHINIPVTQSSYIIPNDRPIDALLPGQTFFDIAGGGFSGNVGRWIDNGLDPDDPAYDKFDHYDTDGGLAEIIIEGYPFIRKVVGGGFYGTVGYTDVQLKSGTVGNIYGGALLGYVHHRAKLKIGSKLGEDYLETPDSVAFFNRNLYVLENVYGGNDIKGIIGTVKWVDPTLNISAKEYTDGGPIFMTDITDDENRGVVLNIYGGTFCGNIYGAGNGHYRGYYVPEWARYQEGPDRQYRLVKSAVHRDEHGNPMVGRVYRSRPMVGCVNADIRGNSATDRINVRGNVFGGGRACSIGQYNTILPFEDPRRLERGGTLHLNLGGHTTIGGNLYLGAEGERFNEHTIPVDITDIRNYDGTLNRDLDALGEIAYDHWYWSTKLDCYLPGFPPPGEVDGNYHQTGEHMFRGYMKNIEMNGDVELTFYRDVETEVTLEDGTKAKIHKHWLPGEIAVEIYDAPDIEINSFFLGGQCGSMTNNNEMVYNYRTGKPIPATDPAYHPEDPDMEEWGAIYRVVLPEGVTIRDKVVGGSEDATVSVYPFGAMGHSFEKTDEEGNDNPLFFFEGGVVTQTNFSYDLICYNDARRRKQRDEGKFRWEYDFAGRLPSDFYYGGPDYQDFGKSRELIDGTVIYRYAYDPNTEMSDPDAPDYSYFPNGAIPLDPNFSLRHDRYSVAVLAKENPQFDENGYIKPESVAGAYCGWRETRPNETAVKITARCKFKPIDGEGSEGPSDVFHKYGGNIFGGCYNSGTTIGDVVLNLSTDHIGGVLDSYNPESFTEISRLRYNLGKVFGGGFGKRTTIEGNTYVNLLRTFVGINVFGGGFEGKVLGKATVNYLGAEADSFVYGSIYGGGLRGDVGVPEEYDEIDGRPRFNATQMATEINLVSGNVDRVYGGSCMGNLYGRTQVNLVDDVFTDLPHLDYSRLIENTATESWSGSRIIAGTVFGGNDVAGSITLPSKSLLDAHGNPIAPDADGYYPDDYYTTTVYLHEEPERSSGSTPAPRRHRAGTRAAADLDPTTDTEPESTLADGPGKQSPGAVNGYNGFPFAGVIYGGSNGNYGVQSEERAGYYESGEVIVCTGENTGRLTINLGPTEENENGFEVPHIERTRLKIEGGTIASAYGGGDMSTVTEIAEITVNYAEADFDARAGFNPDEDYQRVWNVCHINHTQQLEEVMQPDDNGNWISINQINRIFGGNNKADMAIQPSWHLIDGQVGTVYSGGNFGRMTYYNPNPDEEAGINRGLTLTIDSPKFRAGEVYGGGRIGDIDPEVGTNTVPDDFYGASLIIRDGVVGQVYGGNDVAGEVMYGTRVSIEGAISGDVYCAGNGNHYYQFDHNRSLAEGIGEKYDPYLGRYFILPRRPGYVEEPEEGEDVAEPIPAMKLLAINAWRPNVEKSSLTIAGRDEENIAYVHGNVYCGGNSATVRANSEEMSETGGIRFSIGNNVILNGVFMGSNGQALSDGNMIYNTEVLNGIDMAKANQLSGAEKTLLQTDQRSIYDVSACEIDDYPYLLDLYMRAVEVSELPRDFEFRNDLHEAYIGDFYVGGNCGSMLTDRTISLTFPDLLTIYGKVVGGSNNANVIYKNITHVGGLTRKLRGVNDETEKVHMTFKNRFEPWRLVYTPAYVDRGNGTTDNPVWVPDHAELVPDINENGTFGNYSCMVYGGCYASGRTVGSIGIDLYSDMLAEYDADSPIGVALREAGITSKRAAIVKGINMDINRTFGVIGAGFGAQTEVFGDVRVRMLPGKAHPTYNAEATVEKPYVSDRHPSLGGLFGGSHEGLLVGNTTLEIRDGTVLSNVYGGSETASMYGSTQILIGWPKYYVCDGAPSAEGADDTDGIVIAHLNRTDDLSKASKETWQNADGSLVVRNFTAYRRGDIVSLSAYAQMPEETRRFFHLVDNDMPHTFEVGESNAKPLTWDDIDIHIGDPASRTDIDAPYYGHGNVYGGGYVSAQSNVTLAGRFTVRRFDDKHNLDPRHVNVVVGQDDNGNDRTISAGGNSTIIAWDNYENADLKREIDDIATVAPGKGHASAGALIRDHITIGTGHYCRVDDRLLVKGQNLMGYYLLDEREGSETYGKFIHQSSHVLTADDITTPGRALKWPDGSKKQYFYIESDGGIYGGGRKVYTEGFRNADVAYYGYADYSPQFPKLLNTAQRIDLLSLTDCCLSFQGANDFATNTLDATTYSLTRIGELVMNSSLPADQPLNPGFREHESSLYNILHTDHRTRNYVSFFHSVLYVAAITSNNLFNEPYRGANGQLFATGDYLLPQPVEGDNASEAARHAPAHQVTDLPTHFSYKQYKNNRIENYYRNCNLDDTDNATLQSQKVHDRLEFDQRNVGTAANMIGINNGYVLKVQGVRTDDQGTDHIYYGPITGVCEIKLLTLAMNEGGGYIFALNQHDDPDSFLESTGNFVFPGAAYLQNSSSSATEQYNYIYDDCFPMGLGWEHYYGWDKTCDYAARPFTEPMVGYNSDPSAAPQRREAEGEAAHNHGNCNELQDIHYWYVNGNNFFYNVTLTAYTFNDEMDFTLDNNDQLIYLYGVHPDPKLEIEVESVTWTPSFNELPDLPLGREGNGITDNKYDLPYELYLSIDKNTASPHSLTSSNNGHSFVAPIARANFPAEEGELDDTVGAPSKGVNNYSDYSPAEQNMPLLGISLYDSNDNSGREYYDRHLKEDEKVSIRLRCTLPAEDGVNVSEFIYTINLTIKYLLGPSITGYPVIENGALPGEYIYANTFDVKVDLDDANMAVNERNWYIIAPEHKIESTSDIRNYVQQIKNPDIDSNVVGECINDCKFDSDRQIHIPAYLYRNGWNLVYEIVANNTEFYRLPEGAMAEYLGAGESSDNDSNSQEALIGGTVTKSSPYAKHLVVHNYHRMRPYDGTSIITDEETGVPVPDADGNTQPKYEDLHIIAGSRIYIEDDEDMKHFYRWLYDLQQPSTRKTPRGWDIDPQYAEGLHVFLMNDVHMPQMTLEQMEAVKQLRFRGVFHGNGHTIIMRDNTLFLGRNAGEFYNTGFVNENATTNPVVITTNTGKMENCFFYNAKNLTLGTLVDKIDTNMTTGEVGRIVNCFQTSPQPQGVTGLRQASLDEFNYGEIAYNLNRYYLRKRFLNATGVKYNIDEDMRPLNHIFADGEYRFAEWSIDGNSQALRTAAVPNYHDYLGIRIGITAEDIAASGITGIDATNHNVADLIDESRAQRDPDTGEIVYGEDGSVLYIPNFPFDYLFFGQDLSEIASFALVRPDEQKAYPGVPTKMTEENRVFRASGFYGSKIDYGFHFNHDAMARQSTLTAIDFSGYRDYEARDHAVVGKRGKDGFFYTTEDEPYSGPWFQHNQIGYYLPMLDLPEEGIESFMTDPDAVTHNLLVYSESVDGETPHEIFEPYIYTRTTPEEDIFCHIIDTFEPSTADPTVSSGRPATMPKTRLMHLVDRHDFNCPIEYEVTDTIWYIRQPDVYSNGNDAWEGLCLPFTVRTVTSAVKGESVNAIRNHGELTHFFGPHVALDVEADSHEYWLRKFTGYKEENGVRRVYFTRPHSEEDSIVNRDFPGNPNSHDLYRDYHYSNDYFSVAFGNIYTDGTTHARLPYTAAGVDYRDYPMITERVPYIVSFPGRRFYEFDLSGQFYHDTYPNTPVAPQRLTYAHFKPVPGDLDYKAGDPHRMLVHVSDEQPPIPFEHDGYTYQGTWMHRSSNSVTAIIHEESSENRSQFDRVASPEEVVEPFRTYFVMPSSNPAPMKISSRSIDIIDSDQDEGDGNPDEYNDIEIFLEDNDLIVVSPFDEMNLPLYDPAGRLMRILTVATGENRYSDLTPGYYILLTTKFRIK